MVDRDAVRRAYDELAETYASHRSRGGVDVLNEFLDTLEPSARVLDAGCGQGAPVLVRTDRVATPVGLDFSRAQLGLAAGTVPDAPLVQGDMTSLPLREDAFDAALAYWSLIHVPLDDHQSVLDEFARVLRPGGRVLVCEGTTEWVGENPDWLDSGVEMQWEIAGADATRDQLEAAGFTVLDSWGVPESLSGDGDDASWTFFAARLDVEATAGSRAEASRARDLDE